MNANGKILTKTLAANGEEVVVLVLTWETDEKTYYQIAEGTYKSGSDNKFTRIYAPVSMRKTEIDKDTISKIIQGDVENFKKRIEFSYRAENCKLSADYDYLFDNDRWPWTEDKIQNLHCFYDAYKEVFDLTEEKTSCQEVKEFIQLFKTVKSCIKTDN